MGTYYRVTSDCAIPAAQIEQELLRVNEQMSNYDLESQLSRLNQTPVGQWQAIAPQLHEVLRYAEQLHALSEGAFDITVAPVLALWGFGPNVQPPQQPPSSEQLQKATARVDGSAVSLRAEPPTARRDRDVTLDLSAIAKGHGVDRLAALLMEKGCRHFLVDIGGEVRAFGQSASKRPWRVGVEVPDPQSMGAVARIVRLQDQAIATSGDYRNYIELEPRVSSEPERWSHTIDPRTARPVQHGLASVSVIAASAMEADALATALNVLGPEAGMALARQQRLAALFIERTAQGFSERYTDGFADALESP